MPSFLDRLSTLKARAAVAARFAVGVFSDSAMTQAHGLLAGMFPGAAGAPPYRGTREFLQAYNTMPWLRAVVQRVASSVATVPWRLYVARGQDGKAYRHKALQTSDVAGRARMLKELSDDQELTEITDHPFLDLMNDGNTIHTGLTVRKLSQIYLETVGEVFLIKERDGLGIIKALWPIPPNWIISTTTPQNRFYRVSFRGWQGEIPETELMHVFDPNPETPYYRGSGVGMSLSDELETDEYAARMMRQYFYNSAKPDFIVYPKNNVAGDQNLRDGEVGRFEQDWLNRHQGFWKAFKPHFLSREVGIHEFNQGDLQKMQFVQLREFERSTIIQTYGVPPELLGVLTHSNRATVEAADYLFSRWTLQPRLEFLRAYFQERLIPEFDPRLILDFVNPVQDDKQFELAAATVAPWCLSIDEWRSMCGHDDLAGGKGEAYMLPFGMMPSKDFSPPKIAPAPGTPGKPASSRRPPRGAGQSPQAPANKARRWSLLP